MNDVYFLNMFSEYQPSEKLYPVLSQAAIAAADIDPERGTVEVLIDSKTYIPARILATLSREISAMYGLRRLILRAIHPADQLPEIEIEELRDHLLNHALYWNDKRLFPKTMVEFRKGLIEHYRKVAQGI